MGARMVPANGQTTKTKKIFYMSFWLESLSILLQIYTFACNFYSRKGGGVCFYWVACFYWDIYSIPFCVHVLQQVKHLLINCSHRHTS